MTQRNILSEPVQGFDALKAEPEGNLTLRQVMRVEVRKIKLRDTTNSQSG